MASVWLWWSTGKDSAWSLRELADTPGFEVERLVTTITPTFGRVAIHGTRTEVLDAQAFAAGLPIQNVELPYSCSNAEYEAAVVPVLREAEAQGVSHMAFGDFFLADARAYHERMFDSTSMLPVFPLWGRDTRGLANEMFEAGVGAVVTSLDPT